MTAIRTVFTVGTPSNRLLRFALLVLAAIPTLLAAWRLLGWQLPGIDLLIPLLATQRWVDGGTPYVAASFHEVAGSRPAVPLPAVRPPAAGAAPPAAVGVGPCRWVGICFGVAAWTLGRLRVPLRWMPVFLVWAPFLEGIVSGNVGIVAFAAFVALFFAGRRHPPTSTRSIEIRRTAAWPACPRASRRRRWPPSRSPRCTPSSTCCSTGPGAALAGLACLGLLVAVTLPFTGLAIYGDWVAQLGRAADPTWIYAGTGAAAFLPPELTLVIAACSVVALWWVPRRSAGMWVGILAVVGGLSLHTYGLLFLLPAMLRLRREIALVGALFIGSLNPVGLAVGAAIIVLGAAASIAYPALREPER